MPSNAEIYQKLDNELNEWEIERDPITGFWRVSVRKRKGIGYRLLPSGVTRKEALLRAYYELKTKIH